MTHTMNGMIKHTPPSLLFLNFRLDLAGLNQGHCGHLGLVSLETILMGFRILSLRFHPPSR